MLLINTVIQLVVMILISPLTMGIIKKLKAWSQHRKGVPLLQPYFDLIKLFKKDMVVSENASWIFHAAPYVYLVSILTAGAMITIVPGMNSMGFAGDAILLVYMLSMGRFFMALSGMDTGSTFGGMGSSREMMISSLIEPSLMVSLFAFGLAPSVKSLNLETIFSGAYENGMGLLGPSSVLILAALLIVTIAESSRIPVDDPSTHLELTMVHEAMILEYSGRYLSMIQLATALKQVLFSTLIVNLFLTFGYLEGSSLIIISANVLIYIIKILVVSAVIGLIEINSVKLRIFSIPNLAITSFVLAFTGFITTVVLGGI